MTKTNGSGRIYWVGGSKGGVGKSMMTVATLDHLLEGGAKVLLVECDTSNPDVWKAYREQIERSSSTSMRRTDRFTSSTRATGTARGSWW